MYNLLIGPAKNPSLSDNHKLTHEKCWVNQLTDQTRLFIRSNPYIMFIREIDPRLRKDSVITILVNKLFTDCYNSDDKLKWTGKEWGFFLSRLVSLDWVKTY